MEATGSAGATVDYPLPTATDVADASPAVNCSPAPQTTFPIGTTTVTCTATDASSNASAPTTFTVAVVDSQPPTLTNPGAQTVEATGPGGAAVVFTVAASDTVSGNPPVTCNPASGSTFPLGSTPVNCSAQDGSGHTGNSNFTVTVRDTTAPTFSNVPAPIVLEANSPAGSSAHYGLPTAVDLVSGAIPVVVCSPASDIVYPIATTTVGCTARDAAGNIGSTSFTVRVADRTPPVISAPPSLSIYATTPTGTPSNDPTVIQAASFITADDAIDSAPPLITNDMPSFLPLGHTLVHFYATDKSGNRAGVNMDVVVIQPPAAGPAPPLPQPDAQPPGNVSNLSARPGNRAITLSWALPTAADFDHVVVYRSDPSSAELGSAVHTGKGKAFTDKGLTNGTQYRYVVVSYDKTGNRSAGLAILATPQALRLTRPKNGALVAKPPVLAWLGVSEADYYNVQLFKESGKALSGAYLSNAQKILTVWPTRTQFALKRTWKFQGRTYRLAKGTYRWFVWPGFGNRAENNYGPMIGQSTFRVSR